MNKKNDFNGLVYFEAEFLSAKSPITVIDAPFGTGKTYFIKKLIENISTLKVKSKIFKNYLYINVYSYANSKNIPDDFLIKIIELFSSELKIKPVILSNFICIFLPKLVDSIKIVLPFLEISLKEIMKKSQKDRTKEKIKSLEEMSAEIKPTIIFLDNIERLGKDAWEIIKAIQKISWLNNFVFVLPMHLKFLKENENLSVFFISTRFVIAKYINFNIKYKYAKRYISLVWNY